MNMENEKWTEEVMNSLDGIKKAEPGPFLYNKILHKINEGISEYTPMKIVWLAAASFAILIILNWTAAQKNKNSTNQESPIEQLADQYQLLNSNPVNYN